MKETTVESLDFQVPILYYESVEEVNKDANSQTAAIEIINQDLDFHGARGDARDVICEVLEEMTGISPIITDTGKKDAKGRAITKTENQEPYASRVLAKLPEGVTKAALQEEITRRARGYKTLDEDKKEVVIPPIAVSAKPRPPRKTKVAILGEDYVIAGRGLLANPKATDEKINQYFLKAGVDATKCVFKRTGVEETDATAIGWLFKAKDKVAAAVIAAKRAAGELV